MSRRACPCVGCDRPAPGDQTICGACEAELSRALDAVPEVARDLDVTLSRQTSRTGGGWTSVVPLPFDARASEVGWVLRSALAGWVRQLQETQAEDWPADTPQAMAGWLSARLERLVRHPAAEEAHGEIVTAVAAAQRAVDLFPDRWYAGVCAAPLDGGGRCQRDLYAKPKAATVTCPECGHRWDVPERRTWLLGMAEDVLATATEIARAVTTLGQPVTPEAIRGYVHRKQLVAHGSRLVGTRETPVYRLGDVLDILARRAERDGSMAS
ncbi:DUF1922 domain-containing protein [Spirillospora sp. NBC_00431]